MKQEIIRLDFDTVSADGTDNITQAILGLVNEYPALAHTSVNEIKFQLLEAQKGIALYANPSVAILSEKVSITDHVSQKCAYAFTIVYRVSQSTRNKERYKEWLDNLGRWLEMQPIKINGEIYKLDSYPTLDEGKEFESIKRTMQSYLYQATDDKAEDWAINLQATYYNEYDK